MKKIFFKFNLIFVAILFLIFIPTSLNAQKSSQKVILKGFSEFVNVTMKEWKVPGLAIAIIKDGEIILSEGFGLRDVKKGLKVTPQTLFAIGSCTKAFTAVSLGILVDEGKLDWDKPVRNYLPTFKLFDPIVTERMTPCDLITHRSGLPGHDLVWYGSSLTRKELFDRLQYLELSKDFRLVWQYQNLMYLAAGLLVEQISGITWEEFVQKRILEPLGMKNSNFSVNESQKASDFALPYREEKNEVKEIPFRNIDAMGPAGSMNSNVTEMANWILLNLNKGKFGKNQIISEANLAQIHFPQMVIQQPIKYDELFYASYGMGWLITAYRGHLMISHGGGIDGFTALVTFMPRDKIGVVILTNMSGTPIPEIIACNVYDRFLGLDQIPWNKRIKDEVAKAKEEAEKAKKDKDKDRKPDTKPSHPLEEYAGDFEHPGYGVVSIRKEGDDLKATFNSMSFSVKHYHYDIFELTDDSTGSTKLASFSTDIKGNISSVSIQMEPAVKEIIFTRMPEKKMQERKEGDKL
ncbi:MAG: serine hydrolase [Acidobacteriota bacterium]